MEQDKLDMFREAFIASGDWYRGEDNDSYSLVFVVRDRVASEDGVVVFPDEDSVVICAMNAMLELLSLYADDEKIKARVDGWLSARIRKIVKRAHGSKWNKVVKLVENGELPGVIADDPAAAVACFAPMRASEQPKAIKQLQVSGLDLDRKSSEPSSSPCLHVVLEESLEMSSGKTIAQCGHAVQLAFKYLDDGEYEFWKEVDFSIDVERASILDVVGEIDCPVIVRDAGFTEIPAGSMTAAAYFA